MGQISTNTNPKSMAVQMLSYTTRQGRTELDRATDNGQNHLMPTVSLLTTAAEQAMWKVIARLSNDKKRDATVRQ